MINSGVFIYIQIKLTIKKKKYIGITCQKPESRWGVNGEHYNGQENFIMLFKNMAGII